MRARRIAVAWLRGLGVGVSSLALFAGSVVLHLDSAPGRRLTANVVTQVMEQTFRGRLVIDHVDRLFIPTGRIAAAAHLYDPQGREVASVERVTARLDVRALVGSLVSSGPLRVRIRDLEVGPGKVALIKSVDAGVSIAEAFQPRTPSKPDDTPSNKPLALSFEPATVSALSVSGDALPFREPLVVAAQVNLTLPIGNEKLPRGVASTKVTTRGVDLNVTASAGDRIVASVRGHTTPEIATSMGLPVTPTAPIDVTLDAEGPLDRIALTGRVSGAGTRIDLKGTGNAEAGAANVVIDLHDADARLVDGKLPASRIDGHIELDARSRDEHVEARVRLEPGTIAGQSTPALDVQATMDGARVAANVHAYEPGTDVKVKAAADLGTPEKIAHVVVDADSRDLARLRAIAPDARGSADVHADVTIGIAATSLAGRVTGNVRDFAWGNVARAGHAAFEAELSGTFAQPAALASIRGERIAVGSIRGDRVAAGGMVRVGSLIIDAPYFRIERGDTVIRAEASRFSTHDGITVDDLRVSGLGGPVEGRAKVRGETISLRLAGGGVRLEPLAIIGALPPEAKGGVDLDVDLTLSHAGVDGHARAKVVAEEIGRAPTVTASLDLRGRGKKIDIEAHGDARGIGTVDIPRGEVVIDGSPLAPRTWMRAAGNVAVESDVDLDELAHRFLDESAITLSGRAHTRVRLTRRVPGGPVATDVELRTQGFAFETSNVGMKGAELMVRGHAEKDSASASVEAFDGVGPLFSARAAIGMGTNGGAIEKAPLHATLVVPARSLDPIHVGGDAWGERTRAAALVEVSGTLKDTRISAWMRGIVEGLGSLRVDDLAAEWQPERETLPRGHALVRGLVDLEGLSRELATRMQNAPQLSGVLDVEAEAQRADGQPMPSARVSVRSKALTVREPMRLVDTDFRASAQVDASTGDVAISTTVWDRVGPLLVADAKAQLPTSLTPASLAGAIADWSHIPVSARVAMPPRPVASLVALFDGAQPGTRAENRAESRAKRLEGGIALEATMEGTVEKPHAVFRAFGSGLNQVPRRAVDRAAKGKPLDAAVYATYDGNRADLGVTILDEQRAALRTAATVVVSSAELVRTGQAPIIASADIRARKLRVGALPFVGEQATGDVDADIALRNYGENARLEATVDARNVTAQRLKFDRVEARLLAEDGRLAGAVGAAQKDGGWLGAMVRSGMRWGSAAVPSLDDSGPVRLDYRAEKFRLAGLQPILRNVLPELDGVIDGKGSLVREKGTEHAEGSLSLREGRAYLAALGQEVDDFRADLRLGAGTFFVENARAKIDRGEARFAASGRLAGLVPTGVKANIQIPSRSDLPIYFEGVQLGTVNGNVGLDVKIVQNEIRVDADIPNLRFDLAALDPRQVQDLDPAEHVAIGIRDRDGVLKEVRLQRLEKGARKPDTASTEGEGDGAARTTTVHVHLGRNVILSQGTMLFVPLSGDLDMKLAEELKLRGKIVLANGGLINLKGRKFRVENGTITWTDNDEVSNPVVIAEARWQAPDATEVIASYTGPAKTGKLALRSEPARTQGEILSLLLFGTADGPSSGGGGSNTAVAGKAAGGALAGGLSQAFNKLTDLEVEATVESPDAKTTRPEVSWRVRPNVTIQVGYNIAPQHVQRDRVMLTVEYRFAQRWSAQGTAGDRGTTLLDLLWQYRY